TLTDRVDPKRIYLFGVGCMVVGHGLFGLLAEGFWSALALRALTGLGWAGTYMTGIKLLAERVDERLMARAVTGHAAGIGIAGSLSFVCGDAIADAAGWPAAFIAAGASAAIAWLAVAMLVPGQATAPSTPRDGGRLYDFRPVLRNRSAMAYALAYCVHTLEMSALRGWGVAFLGYVAASTTGSAPVMSPAAIATAIGLVGTVASVTGSEIAIRWGRRRLIAIAMGVSIASGATLGFLGVESYGIAVALLVIYFWFAWLDSSSLTAGAAGTAEPSRRGATLAVHSMLGYGGGFVGPLVVGWILDLSGGMSRIGWGLAFLAVAVLVAAALAAFLAIRPKALAGDRRA
ncbi:MAG: MFS transporter, partial [Alphaproteobacteria bacterium]